jgi:hypothetical protein
MNDLTLTVQTVQNEPRILDTDLAERLEFTQARNIRNLIARHHEALSALGSVVQQGIIVGKGQRTAATYLNKPQATFITTQSGTSKAIEVTLEVIKKFDEYERGAIQPQVPNFSNPAEAARAWADQYEQNLIAQEKVKLLAQAKVELELKTEELTEENETISAVLGTHDHRLTHFARTLNGINTSALKQDLLKLGYLHTRFGTYKTYAKFKHLFPERINHLGQVDLFVTGEGKKDLARLNKAGKLTKLKGVRATA